MSEPKYITAYEVFEREPYKAPPFWRNEEGKMKYHFRSGKFTEGSVPSNGLLPNTGDEVVQERLWGVYNVYDKVMGEGFRSWLGRIIIGVEKKST